MRKHLADYLKHQHGVEGGGREIVDGFWVCGFYASFALILEGFLKIYTIYTYTHLSKRSSVDRSHLVLRAEVHIVVVD